MRKESCDTSSSKALATASVTMAKKIARTRSENSPISKRQQRRRQRAGGGAEQRRRRSSAPCVLSAMATP